MNQTSSLLFDFGCDAPFIVRQFLSSHSKFTTEINGFFAVYFTSPSNFLPLRRGKPFTALAYASFILLSTTLFIFIKHLRKAGIVCCFLLHEEKDEGEALPNALNCFNSVMTLHNVE